MNSDCRDDVSSLEETVALEAWLREVLAAQQGCAVETLNPHARFRDIGLESVAATQLLVALSEHLGRPLASTIFWDHPTICALAAYLTRGEVSVESGHSSLPRGSARPDEPMAIIGMACRFPGADGIDAYWDLLATGTDAVTEVPADRWRADDFFNPDRGVPGKTSTRWGGFVTGVGQFDPQFFGIAPREAVEMDPQQRLMLELAWHGLEDAGIEIGTLKGTQTGVFVGAMWSDYARHAAAVLEQVVPQTATGQDHSLIAGRISYLLGLEGPSLVVNTACSSSLVALHLACQSLRAGESELALVGGVSLMLSPYSSVVMSKFGAMSPGGRCRSFDAGADGYVRGEGCGLVVLKPLHRARADGDRIYSVLAGIAVNNDGWSNGLTAPNPAAQEKVVRTACQQANVATDAVQYVETHGPGTILGDPIEAKALGAVLGIGRSPATALRIGSVKTNIGHLEAAAGMAGLIKTSLAIHHRSLPGNLHFDAPNPHIPFTDLGIEVQAARSPWPCPDSPLIAGVSSFGFSGTNCHAVLREPPREVERTALVSPTSESVTASSVERPQVVFVCPGQGGQWHGMGAALLHQEPVFRAAMQDLDQVIAPWTGWSVIDQLLAPADRSRVDEVDVIQPLLFAMQVALGRLWMAHDVEPDAIVGHSMGEAAAAHLAGVLTLDDAARVICHRSRLARELAGRGAMAVVGLSESATIKAIGSWASEVSVASCNSPTSTVISGTPSAVDAVLTPLIDNEVYASRINVDFASHSHQVEPLRGPLVDSLAGLAPRDAARTLISTVTGDALPGLAWDAAYWGRNLRHPVRFAQAVDRLAETGPTVFVELSPHPILVRAVEETLEHHVRVGSVFASLRRDEDERAVLDTGLAALRDHGVPIVFDGGAASGSAATTGESNLDAAPLAPLPTVPVLLPISGRDPAALRAQAGAYLARIESMDDTASLRDLAHGASVRRVHHNERLTIVGATPDDMAECLRHFLAGEPHPAIRSGRAALDTPERPVFLFPGQGAQWLGMGRELWHREPVFRVAIMRCDAAVARHVGWSVVDELRASESTSKLGEIDRVQPVLFAIQVALADLWRGWGIEPGAVVGHSMGEVAAAYSAGALSLNDASAVICRRSRLLRQVSGQGGMALVELSRADAQAYIDAGVRTSDGSASISVAVSNSPSSTVLAGAPTALEAFLESLDRDGVFCRLIQVDVASHSPQMDPLREPLVACLADITPRLATVPMYSTVLDRVLDGTELTAEYWANNLRRPVLFWNAVEALAKGGAETFVELSPHPVLLPSVVGGLQHLGRHHEHCALPSMRRKEDESGVLLRALGALHAVGHPVDWRGVHPRGGRFADLPLYPFQREHYWAEQQDTGQRDPNEVVVPSMSGSTSRIGSGWVPAFAPERRCFDVLLRPDADAEWAYLRENRAHGHQLVPGTVLLELIRAAATATGPEQGDADVVLEGVRFHEPLLLASDGDRALQLVTSRTGAGGATAEVFASVVGGTSVNGTWPRYAFARIVPPDEPVTSFDGKGDVAVSLSEEPTAEQATAFRARLESMGLRSGSSFHGLMALATGPGAALGHLGLPAGLAASLAASLEGGVELDAWHPALLEAALQVLIAAIPDEEDTLHLSAGLGRLRFVSGGAECAASAFSRGETLVVSARVRRAADAWEGDLALTDSQGACLLVAEDVQLVPLVDGAKLLDIAAQRQLGGDRAQAVRDTLTAAAAGAMRRALLEEHVRSALGAVLALSPKRIEMGHSLQSYGTDSVMTLELRNRLEATFGLTLSPSVIWNHPSLGALTEYLAEELGLSLDAEDTVARDAVMDLDDRLCPLDDHFETTEPIEALLDRELALVDALLEGI